MFIKDKYFIKILSFVLLSLLLHCGEPQIIESKFTIISETSNPGYPQSLVIKELHNQRLAFVASGQAGLVIYNVDNPEQPTIVGQWMDTLNSCWSVTLFENYAYLSCGRKLLVRLEIVRTDSIITNYEILSGIILIGYAYQNAVIDTNLICIAGRERFFILNITDPNWPTYAYLNFPNNARSLFVVDSIAYLACEQLGVYTIKIKSTPQVSAEILGSCDTPSNARHLFIRDTLCYVADGRNGLVVLNIRNPQSPFQVGNLKVDGYAQNVYVKDTLAYLACGDGGLKIVNIKNPTQPLLIETVKTNYAKGVYVTIDNLIYVADRDRGLLIVKYVE